MQYTRKGNMLRILGGVLIGVLGTAIIMSHDRPSAPLPEEALRPETQGTETKITLSAEAKETAGIRVEAASLLSMGESLTVPGMIEVSPARAARITPPVSGKIARLLVQLGDSVHAGQALLTLNSFDVAQAQAAIKQASSAVDQAEASIETARAETAQARAGVSEVKAELEQARAKKESAETALERQRELAAAGAFSQAPLQAAQLEVSESQSELLKAQTDLQAHAIVLQRAKMLFQQGIISRAEWERTQLEEQQGTTQVARAKVRAESAKQSLLREQKVFRGDLLSKQVVQTAEAEVRAAEGDVQKAQQNLFRAEQDVHKARVGEEAAHTSLRGAKAALGGAHASLAAIAGSGHVEEGGLLTLYAPIGGTVSELHATPGEAVERSTSLCVLENLSSVLVNASVSEKDVSRVRTGQGCQVTVPAYPGHRFPGVVQIISGHMDEKTRALPVRCLIQNTGGRLKPGMFANVSLEIGARKEALSVPLSALDEDGGVHYLYVEKEGGYERRKVEIGRKTDTSVEVLSGLKPGEKVVTDGIFVLKSESKKSELKGDSN